MGWVNAKWHLHYRRNAEATALEKVFLALDGKGMVTRTHHSDLYQAIVECGEDGIGETDYFAFRCFKNGNLHLTFKRPDLVRRLNQIAGGKRLRGERA